MGCSLELPLVTSGRLSFPTPNGPSDVSLKLNSVWDARTPAESFSREVNLYDTSAKAALSRSRSWRASRYEMAPSISGTPKKSRMSEPVTASHRSLASGSYSYSRYDSRPFMKYNPATQVNAWSASEVKRNSWEK